MFPTSKDTSCFLIGPSAIVDCKGNVFDTCKSSHGDGIQSHSQLSSWLESEDNGYTSVEGNPAMVDSASHNLPLLVSHNLSLEDNLHEGDHNTLDPRSDHQTSPPTGVLPVGSFGRGRGQLKQTFQYYLSTSEIQSSGVGHAALGKGHKQNVWEKGEATVRQTAVNVSTDQMASSDKRQEKSTPAHLPTSATSLESTSETSCLGMESEIELEPKPKPQVSEMEAESQIGVPPSFLFQLLEASHIGHSCGTSENNIASLQKKIGDLEVRKCKDSWVYAGLEEGLHFSTVVHIHCMCSSCILLQ